jgi:hypothetical protein
LKSNTRLPYDICSFRDATFLAKEIIFCLAHDDFVLTSSVTGIVVAIYGKETGAGDFLVHEVLEAGLPQQIEFPIKSSISSQSFTYTMLLT